MRVFVTGATGLIGCHAVARLLDTGHAVRVFVRNPAKIDDALRPFGCRPGDVEVATGSLEDRESLLSGLVGCNGLLHCAGLFSRERKDEALLAATNVQGTRNVLEVAAAARSEASADLERVVYVSSMLALFPPSGSAMTAEDPIARPRSMYAITKADAERIARDMQDHLPLTILYPAAVHGPMDPTFSIGPQLVAGALRDGRVLVTDGGLAYTDVRDLVEVIAGIFEGRTSARRLMGPSFFVPHTRYHRLLENITQRKLSAQRIPGWFLRGMGRIGDLAQRIGNFGPSFLELTYEAAEVLTRSVPLEDSEARRILGRDPIPDEDSFRDLIEWMADSGHIDPQSIGR